jgi:hypothetical protein
MDIFNLKLDTIINKLNTDSIIKNRIINLIKNDVTNKVIDIKNYDLNKKVKELYKKEIEYFYFTIKRRLKANEEINYLNEEAMSDALEEFINKYIFNDYNNNNKLGEYNNKLFSLLFPVKIKKITLDEWLKNSNIIITDLSRNIANYIKSMEKMVFIHHNCKVTKNQLINLMYNYMNKFDVNDERLNLYIDVNKHANNKQINCRTLIPILLKHIYYKSRTTETESYVGPISFKYDVIHLICKLFITTYKLKKMK